MLDYKEEEKNSQSLSRQQYSQSDMRIKGARCEIKADNDL